MIPQLPASARSAATDTRLSTPAPNRYFATLRWRVLMAAPRSLLARLSRIDVLVIDDWAMSSLTEPERRDF